MSRKNLLNIIAILSTLGIICWIISDFYGGMIIYLISYSSIIIPIIIIYLISLVETIISIAKTGFTKNKIKVIFHSALITTIIFVNLLQSELLKSKQVLSATLKDDLFHYTLIFRENGNCENQASGFMGFSETFHGKYKFVGDTIIFKKKPYDNNFIPDTLLIDKKENAIFKGKDESGNFSRKKEWLNHFEIN